MYYLTFHNFIFCLFSHFPRSSFRYIKFSLKMGFGIDKIFVTFGLIALAHAAYSAAQHRKYLRLTEKDFTSLPADIFLQSIIGLVLTCYGIVKVVGDFRGIKATADLEKRTWDALSNRSSFFTFSHRGKVLFHTR